MLYYSQFILENNNTGIYYHGSTDKNLNGKNGIHVGTKKAATQALEARIGVPAEGEWDGTREYGKTLLAGKKRIGQMDKATGFNCGSDMPQEDYYPTDRKERATYSDRTPVPFTCKPIVFPVKIIGSMSNWPGKPHNDMRANSMMIRNLKLGNAKNGYYYINDGEDYGSISAVVPDKSFLQILDNVNENVLVPRNIEGRKALAVKNNLKMLQQEVIEGNFDINGTFANIPEHLVKTRVINGHVTLAENSFSTIPEWLKNMKINGDFLCFMAGLSSLKNCPQDITGTISFSYNNLKNLEGAPKTANGGFMCTNSELQSLEGCPEIVKGTFNVSENNLTNLDFYPKIIGRDFLCKYNDEKLQKPKDCKIGRQFYN